MGRQVAEALDALRNLGTPAEMRALAQQGRGPQIPPRVNAHVHLPPNFSAFGSTQEAVNLAAEQGIGALGVSNYYDYEVYGGFVDCARDRGVFPHSKRHLSSRERARKPGLLGRVRVRLQGLRQERGRIRKRG